VKQATEARTGEQLWTAVDRYITEMVVQPDAILDAALESCVTAGLPQISVSAGEGKLLYLLARIRRAKTILEIGTLAAYSTIWLARSLPRGGRLITLESDPSHAAVARANITRAGLDDVVDLRLGLAMDTLPVLASESHKFDLTFTGITSSVASGIPSGSGASANIGQTITLSGRISQRTPASCSA